MAVNLKSVYLTAKHLVPQMRRSGRGAVLNVCSDEASMITGVALEVDGGRCV